MELKKSIVIGIFLVLALAMFVIADSDVFVSTDYNNKSLYNISNISSDKYCNDTSCYTVTEFLTNTDTTYTAGSNLTLTGTIFSLNTTGVTDWLDTVYAGIATIFDGTWSSLTGKPDNNLNFTNGAGYYNSSDFNITNYLLIADLVGSVGNWSADKGDYSTKTAADLLYAGITEPVALSLGNYSAENSTIARIGDCSSGEYVQNITTDGVECGTPGAAGGGTVTSVATDDTYLTGGAITSTGTITFNSTLAGTDLAVNSSDYWDNLGSPSDIGTGDITDDGTWRLQSWDNFTGIPTADPSVSDTTHLSTAKQIYDWAVGLFMQDLDDDTSPELGGYLDTSGENIGSTSDEIENVYVATDSRIYFGDGQEASIYYNGTALIIE